MLLPLVGMSHRLFSVNYQLNVQGNCLMFTMTASTYKIHTPHTISSLLSETALPTLSSATNHQPSYLEEYDIDKKLGKKTRHLSAATKLFGSVCADLIEHPRIKAQLEANPSQIGIYVAQETVNLDDDLSFDLSIKVHGPDYASPLQAPNTLANVVGSYFATFSGITGPNCTISAGEQGGFHALLSALFSLSENAIDYAIVGGVEVATPYHKVAYETTRDVAVSHIIERVQNDGTSRVRFSLPYIRCAFDTAAETALIAQLSEHLQEQWNAHSVDLVILAFGKKYLDVNVLLSQLKARGMSECLITAETIVGEGESCNSLLSLGLACDLLNLKADTGDSSESVFLKHYATGIIPTSIRTIAVIAADEHGQLSSLLLEKR